MRGAALAPSRIGAVALATMIVWCTIIAYAVHPILPFNAIVLPGESKLEIAALLPQGWGFFSRNPQEESEHFLRRASDGSWQPLLPDSYAGPTFSFGLSRRGRASTQQARWLILRLPATSWNECADAPSSCLQRSPVLNIRSAQAQRSLCGEIGIVMQKPVPWAWARNRRPVRLPSRVARLFIEC